MLLFSAPQDFDLAVMEEYEALYGQRVMWRQQPYTLSHPGITVWVCSPSHPDYVSDDMLALLPNLRILATASTGVNHIDLDACARRGIRVISLLDDRAGLETISASAEWTFKLILEGLRLKRPYHELQGRTVGLVGFGRIGHKIESWCDHFGVEACDWNDPTSYFSVPLETVFKRNNVVVICCALTPETTGMVTYDLLKLLPRDAVLVNTARGEVIDEPALLRFMADRPDVRVCLDVATGEVAGAANWANLELAGAYCSRHIAGDTYESRTKAARIILKLLQTAREAGNGAASPVAEATR